MMNEPRIEVVTQENEEIWKQLKSTFLKIYEVASWEIFAEVTTFLIELYLKPKLIHS